MVAEFAWGSFKGRFRVTKAVAAVRAAKLAIDKDCNASFSRAGAGVVRRKYARGRRRNDKSFLFSEETKRDAHRFVLCGEQRSFAVERINQDAPKSRGGKREKMAAAHVRECSRRTRARHVRRAGR